jgi:hypothetical protein
VLVESVLTTGATKSRWPRSEPRQMVPCFSFNLSTGPVPILAPGRNPIPKESRIRYRRCRYACCALKTTASTTEEATDENGAQNLRQGYKNRDMAIYSPSKSRKGIVLAIQSAGLNRSHTRIRMTLTRTYILVSSDHHRNTRNKSSR